ncbi:radical SAM/SPASM domain-containing protein [Xanthocytophaga agilis]|nr:radical SAM protein [Xanthocytophaga agilis]
MFFSAPKDNRFKQVSTLVVKVTHRCNLDCQYCYEFITQKGEDMSEQTFRQLADRVLENSEQKVITFLFHGGEPTLIANSWYEQGINYVLKKAKQKQQEIRFSMQTNLIHLPDEKIQLFKTYNIQPGVSLDGTADAPDSMRGRESRVFQNFLKLKQAGISCGILTTINHSNYQRFEQICKFLVEQAQVHHFKANVVTSVGAGYNLAGLKAEQIFEAQRAILEYMIETKGQKLTEHNLVTEIERFFTSAEDQHTLPPTLCHEKQCGAGKSVLGVTPKGELLPCGRFQWNDTDYFLGDIHTKRSASTFQQLEEKVDSFHTLVPESWYDCDQCPAQKICMYGCQAFIVRSKNKANVDCLPTKMRFAYYEANRTRLWPVYKAITAQKQGMLPFRIKSGNGHKQYVLHPANQTAYVMAD